MSHFIFSANSRDYSIDHVLQAADFRGELRRLHSLWLPAWLASGQAGEEEGADPHEAILDKLASEFRYARNLVTAEECERWLAGLGLTPDDFGGHIARCGLAGGADLFSGKTGAVAGRDHLYWDDDEARTFRVDLVLSAGFHEMARALAWRVALHCEDHDTQDDAGVAQKEPELESRTSSHGKMEACLFDWKEGEILSEELPGMEGRFQADSKALLVPENQRRALASLRLPLMRLHLEILELESEAAAREAFLCATEDGICLAALADENRHALRVATSFLEALPEQWQQAVLSASPGAILRPFQEDDAFQLCRLVSKQDPALSDPVVRSRVDASLLSGHFRELENRHIRWHVNLELEAS